MWTIIIILLLVLLFPTFTGLLLRYAFFGFVGFLALLAVGMV